MVLIKHDGFTFFGHLTKHLKCSCIFFDPVILFFLGNYATGGFMCLMTGGVGKGNLNPGIVFFVHCTDIIHVD